MNLFQKLPVPCAEGFEFVDFDVILYLRADNSYTLIHTLTDPKPIISSKNLGAFEKQLPKTLFLRVHNSYIINLREIKKYIRADGTYILLSKSVSVPVTRKKALFDALGISKSYP